MAFAICLDAAQDPLRLLHTPSQPLRFRVGQGH
jgi:hypothetical protein